MPRSGRELASHWLPAILVMAGIFYLSSQSYLPSPPDSVLNLVLKKLGHITVYTLLALAYLRALHQVSRPFLLAWFLSALFAVSDEYHQSLVPLRTASLVDVLIDVSSAAVALWVAKWSLVERSGWLGTITQKMTLVTVRD